MEGIAPELRFSLVGQAYFGKTGRPIPILSFLLISVKNTAEVGFCPSGKLPADSLLNRD